MRETGFLQVDVEYDFLRARRHSRPQLALARPPAAGRTATGSCCWIRLPTRRAGAGERQPGRQTIRLDTTTDAAEPRRDFRPALPAHLDRVRFRWSGWRWPGGAVNRSRRSRFTASAAAIFVIDGHHRTPSPLPPMSG